MTTNEGLRILPETVTRTISDIQTPEYSHLREESVAVLTEAAQIVVDGHYSFTTTRRDADVHNGISACGSVLVSSDLFPTIILSCDVDSGVFEKLNPGKAPVPKPIMDLLIRGFIYANRANPEIDYGANNDIVRFLNAVHQVAISPQTSN